MEAGPARGLEEDPSVICHLGKDQAGFSVEELVGGSSDRLLGMDDTHRIPRRILPSTLRDILLRHIGIKLHRL